MLMVFAALLLVALLTRAFALKWYSSRAERAARRVDGVLRELDRLEALASKATQTPADADDILRTAQQNSDYLLARSRESASDLLHWILSNGQALGEEPVALSDLVQRTAAEVHIALDRAYEDAASFLRQTRVDAARDLESAEQESRLLARAQSDGSTEGSAQRTADTLREQTREEVRTLLDAVQHAAEVALERAYEEAVARLLAAKESSNPSGATPREFEGDGE